ncbi:cytochrome b [Nocardia mexicana]|uniref:Cytochrome b561 n=1 Tax=Nocardia mexicana TaxID=279262 RepID=A0A370H9U8_9NOCA|nr:cytochrome b [Nocardia mexicana]RDI53438.1 cytochrome b561 [Nocardia mexicana]
MTLREAATDTTRFGMAARILHWLMAVSIVAMIFIGGSMVGSLGNYGRLLSIHKTLGLVILVLAIIRIANRVRQRPPRQDPDPLSRPERLVATASEILMYVLFLAQPIVGWCLVSASGIPIRILGGLYLPAIVPTDAGLYAGLRTLHSVLAYALLAAFTAHICAVLFHALILRDTVLRRMTFGGSRGGSPSR